ncbi:hypothetical protein D3C75_931520 [compost metagenome]
MRRGKRGERHHSAIFIAYIPLVNVFRQHAVFRPRLHIHLLHTTTIHEIVHVARTPGGLQRVIDIINRYTQRLRFTLIDIDLHLRAVVQTIVANAGQQFFVASHLQQLIARLH